VSEAELRAYHACKRPLAVWTLSLAGLGGLVVALKSPVAGAALAFGGICGLANALLVMRGAERLVEHRSVGSFVFSSVLRIFVFGIVPVGFCLHGPWWSLGTYFIGFFLPLGLYAMLVARTIRTG